jgi:hypothetical protein
MGRDWTPPSESRTFGTSTSAEHRSEYLKNGRRERRERLKVHRADSARRPTVSAYTPQTRPKGRRGPPSLRPHRNTSHLSMRVCTAHNSGNVAGLDAHPDVSTRAARRPSITAVRIDSTSPRREHTGTWSCVGEMFNALVSSHRRSHPSIRVYVCD